MEMHEKQGKDAASFSMKVWMLLVFALCGCVQALSSITSDAKASASTSSTQFLTKDANPKILFTCTLRSDAGQSFYVYQNASDELSIVRTTDTIDKPLPFDLIDHPVKQFPVLENRFDKDLVVGSVKYTKGDVVAWLTLVANPGLKTVEVVRYTTMTNRLESVISNTDILTQTEVLFSSNHCEDGKTVFPNVKESKTPTEDRSSENHQDAREGLANTAASSRVIENPVPSREAVDVTRQLIDGGETN